MNQKYDVIIAGAGLAGLLTCLRFKAMYPDQSLCLVEMSKHPGGRLVSSDDRRHSWPSGLVGISKPLLDFLSHTLKAMPFSYELSQFESIERLRLGVLAGGELSTFFTKDALDGSWAYAVDGAPGRKQWHLVLELLQQVVEGDASFLKAWKHEKKNPALPALEALLRCLGICDLWSASLAAIKERIEEFLLGHFYAPWEAVFEEMVGFMEKQPGFHSYFDAAIVGCDFSDGLWQLKTKKGQITGSTLVVAQPVWLALNWLPRHHIPVDILNMALKTKPVSLLTLSEGLNGPCPLPDITSVASEQVEVFHQKDHNLCYQIPLDYEVSLDAPEVIKALRRLRRAQRKIHKQIDTSVLSGEKLSLQPVAWHHSGSLQDARWMKPLSSRQTSKSNTPIAFVGDSYGPSFCGDKNLLQSLLYSGSEGFFSSLSSRSELSSSFAEARHEPQEVPS